MIIRYRYKSDTNADACFKTLLISANRPVQYSKMTLAVYIKQSFPDYGSRIGVVDFPIVCKHRKNFTQVSEKPEISMITPPRSKTSKTTSKSALKLDLFTIIMRTGKKLRALTVWSLNRERI